MSESNLAVAEQREKLFDALFSEKELGCIVQQNTTTFRVFAPRATHVQLVLFNNYDDEQGEESEMGRDNNGIWECIVNKNLTGKYYGYRVEGPAGKEEMFNPNIVIADPYSKAVVTKNNFLQPAKTHILETSYDWEGDNFTPPAHHNELIIYELHVRDFTAHPSSGVSSKGTYSGLTESGKAGGMSYLKDLGVNAIELMPIQKFGNIEPLNPWNPYEQNHWGYMTSYFFAPETYYATDHTLERERYNGIDGRAIREFKDMVKAFHREGIAVILDVVFNHVSHYDYNPLKYIDKFYYFHCDAEGHLIQKSGCGNDLRTDHPMTRRLILDCIKYWMTEYHIDGFRFDIATLVDRETCRQVLLEAKKINPNAILIAEPWGGGGWDPAGFSDIGWSAWNDVYRNGIKGKYPRHELGFIFGTFHSADTKKSVMNYITGTLRENGGLFLKKEHSINYLESHDDHTLGDFIRLSTGETSETQVIHNVDQHVILSPRQLALNKLAALILFTSQGPLMIHEGQEFARSKVIVPTTSPDPKIGTIDHNSYNKDNETNYLNYQHRNVNRELYDYYKGLIELRKQFPQLSSASRDDVKFLGTEDDFLIAFTLLQEKRTLLVIVNGNASKTHEFELPKGIWTITVNAQSVSLNGSMGKATQKIAVPPTSGMILTQP